MLFRRYGTFAGGIDLPDEKHITGKLSIEAYRPASPLRVPLGACGPVAATAVVEAGQKIAAGERIAKASGPAAVDVFCPVAGTVTGVTTAQVAVGNEFVRCPAIEISPEDGSFELGQPETTFDWEALDGQGLHERIAGGGLTTYRRPIEPLTRWIDRARAKRCKKLIANGMESQPYVAADHRLLVEYGREVVCGLTILARTIEAEEVILAADSRRTGDYQQTVEPARAHRISRVALPHKYPIGADAMLVKVLTRWEVPPGGSTMDTGVAVIDAATCLAVFRWVACGSPPTGRVVTVAGHRAPHVRNYCVPFGTRCLELVGQAEQPVIHNGPMIGLRCPSQAVVSPATDAVLALDASLPAAPSACIRCSWCTDHCPARLNVAELNDAFELWLIDRARKLAAPACVECGVCTYVCPARLPLSQRVKQLKRAIRTRKRPMPLFAPR